ncbi:MAG: tetratricopeptide (TPR) repeat protein [Hyphomicrobiaceae bacterium]
MATPSSSPRIGNARKATPGVRTTRNTPRATPRLTPRTTVNGFSPVNAPAVTGVTPRLVPRLASPRLGAARNGYRIGRQPYAEASYRWGAGYRGSSLWCGYWGYGSSFYGGRWGNSFGNGFGNGGFGNGGFNNCGFNNWGFGNSGFGNWGFNNWGFDPFSWNVGVLSPYNAFRGNYWNSCYRNRYWSSFSIPNALPSSYWWYPTTSYCPTYLSVPSSVVVEEELEPIDEGYSIVDTARSVGAPALGASGVSPPAPASTPAALASQYIELGDFYFKNDRFDAAAEAYAKARNHVPDDASIHFVLADAVFANGDYHYAAFLIAEAIRLDPAMVTADVDKRTFYSDKLLFETQLEALQTYCTGKPYDAWAQLVLAYNLRFSDRPTRSVAAFRRVLELDDGNPTARAFLADLVPALSTDLAPKKAGEGKEVADKKVKVEKSDR